MNKAEEKTLKGIVVVLAIASFISCFGFIVEGKLIRLDSTTLIAGVLTLWPIIIPIYSLYFLKVKYNKITEKEKNIYTILFLILNFLVTCLYVFLLLVIDALHTY